MNAGPTPPRPDDDASDPLLAALRQRLGTSYGQAPPPGAWAAIRQQLPRPAVPQPWWRRPRRLLPLLGLLLGLVGVGTLAIRRGRLGQPGQIARAGKQHVAKSLNEVFTTPSSGKQAGRKLATTASQSAASAAGATSAPSSALSPADSSPASTTGAAAARAAGKPSARVAAAASSLSNSSSTSSAHTGQKIALKAMVQSLAARRSGPRAGSQPEQALKSAALTQADQQRAKLPASPAGLPAGRASRDLLRVASRLPVADASASLASVPAPGRLAASAHTQRFIPRTASRLAGPGSERHQAAPLGIALPPTSRRTLATAATGRASATQSRFAGIVTLAPDADEPAALPIRVDSLVQRVVAIGLPAALPSPELAARPDTALAALPVRRWSVLLLAGPTLSYRTLSPAPAAAAGPDFARLERPAAGLGAQVQVRRVLSGRWALAVGLGYQEYATRLALSVKDTVYFSVHQRDTYRLLTLPVQLSYNLGAPRGRLATALLAGAEPGWYQGGRSTEGSGCGCQQQVYTSAAASPYRPWNLAFSLGLDLRYHVGGPASRWQWLVQPTGRYVLTPSVRSAALGYARRQPFSLGLLTGFSWDLR